jgi:hypothetical protein
MKPTSSSFTDEVLPLNGLLPGHLLYRPGVEVDLQMVHNHLPRDLKVYLDP